MKRFSRGDFVRIAHSNVFGVVTEVSIVNNKIEYLILNIEGKYEKVLADEVNEIVKVRPFTVNHG